MILKGRPRQLVLEAATPGHQHEWRLFQQIKLPDDKILVPGVIDVTNNYVEHPEVVADHSNDLPASSGASGWLRRPIPALLPSQVTVRSIPRLHSRS